MVAYAQTCAIRVSNQHDTTMTHFFNTTSFSLTNQDILLQFCVLKSNTEHIEHAFCTKTCLSLLLQHFYKFNFIKTLTLYK